MTAQRNLAAHDWPPGWPLRVRMGLHTGEGVLGGENYLGMDVNRAARIADAAHGGQVILSQATRALVEHSLPEAVSLRDLGQHRLKDIAHPEHLHDLVIEGLEADFPPPRTLDARPNNLPVQLTSFVGREDEIAEVRRLLGRTRLLTLTGAGGTGKTRLCLRVAAEVLTEFADGAYFADLSPLTDPALVPSVLAQALGVPEVAGRPILEAVKDHVRDKEVLLIADNFEQVAEAGPEIEELLAGGPRVKVTARFRAPPRRPHPGPVRSCAAVHRAGDGGQPAIRGDGRERPGRGGDHRPARRPAPGHRAGGHPGEDPHAATDVAPSAAAAVHPHHRSSDPPAAPADPPRRHRLELRPAGRSRATPVCPSLRVHGGLVTRRRGRGLRAEGARSRPPRRVDLARGQVAGPGDRAR